MNDLDIIEAQLRKGMCQPSRAPECQVCSDTLDALGALERVRASTDRALYMTLGASEEFARICVWLRRQSVDALGPEKRQAAREFVHELSVATMDRKVPDAPSVSFANAEDVLVWLSGFGGGPGQPSVEMVRNAVSFALTDLDRIYAEGRADSWRDARTQAGRALASEPDEHVERYTQAQVEAVAAAVRDRVAQGLRVSEDAKGELAHECRVAEPGRTPSYHRSDIYEARAEALHEERVSIERLDLHAIITSVLGQPAGEVERVEREVVEAAMAWFRACDDDEPRDYCDDLLGELAKKVRALRAARGGGR